MIKHRVSRSELRMRQFRGVSSILIRKKLKCKLVLCRPTNRPPKQRTVAPCLKWRVRSQAYARCPTGMSNPMWSARARFQPQISAKWRQNCRPSMLSRVSKNRTRPPRRKPRQVSVVRHSGASLSYSAILSALTSPPDLGSQTFNSPL